MRWAAWIATGGGIGYFPVFPGTLGSLVGLLLFLPLQGLSNGVYILFLFAVFGLGVYTSGLSEAVFQQKDAGAIIIDEIHAMLLVPFFASTQCILVGRRFSRLPFLRHQKAVAYSCFRKDVERVGGDDG